MLDAGRLRASLRARLGPVADGEAVEAVARLLESATFRDLDAHVGTEVIGVVVPEALGEAADRWRHRLARRGARPWHVRGTWRGARLGARRPSRRR